MTYLYTCLGSVHNLTDIDTGLLYIQFGDMYMVCWSYIDHQVDLYQRRNQIQFVKGCVYAWLVAIYHQFTEYLEKH